ncbi:protein disulfide-isomerase domain [Exophiala spinifera]|uniref:protein disulfide-isomerase n=1 Tax=Exophiala spinifera TaxID=91928 RepID=A0A0D2A911_9EURO|nr:protein disulfide-isomerase domain [Exophiala spinifera]KIW21277.1 protein disulfide-isomerase domain [Exophiala spinifera]
MARSSLLTWAVLALACLEVDALYSKTSPVLQVTGKTYDSLIAQSNHTSIVEFYAPWCGHCQNLKPAYEKAAKGLAGLAKVAAVDCDDEANKPFCGQMGIQGFPTLKIVKPGKKPGRPIVEDYNGPRSAKDIVQAVKDKIPNHVKRLQGEALEEWLKDSSTPAKALIFTDKGTTSPLVKSLAVDFLGSIAFAQIRHKETAEKFGVTNFPTVQLIPAAGEATISYDGEISRDALVNFFSQVAPPNPDPAPKKSRAAKSTSKHAKSSSSASAAFSKASEAHKSSDFNDYLGSSRTIVLDDDTPTNSPLPIVEPDEKPMVVPDVIPPIPIVSTAAELEAACLTPRSANCLLVLVPATTDPEEVPQPATSALAGIAEIVQKHSKRKANMIPAYAVTPDNPSATLIRQELELAADGSLEIVALNMKRRWWRRYESAAYDVLDLENFIDAIKLGEGSRTRLPDSFGGSAPESTAPEQSETIDSASSPAPEPTASTDHDEL